MEETHSNNYPKEDEINLLDLFYVLWEGKWTIVSMTAFVSIVGIIYSLSLPNIYESKTMLVPVNSSSGISGALGGYSGLAGLAGISLSSGGEEGNTEKALQKINSLSFFENNILTNIYLPDLMAVKSWNSKTNTLSYNENILDPEQHMPTAQESFKVFKSKLSLNVDNSTGFVTLSIKHQSPFISKQWTELVVNEINAFYRQKDKSESEKAVSYLNEQISMTGLSEIKQSIVQLMQEEIKKLTLIEANQYYVFDYIDPPAVMERKSEPKRSLIFILSALLGGMLSIVLVFIRHYLVKSKVT